MGCRLPSTRVSSLAIVMLLLATALAWGEAGHRTIGRIAQGYYHDALVLKWQYDLLNNSDWWTYSTLFPEGPIAWADTYSRTNPGRWSYGLHFAYTDHLPYFDYQVACNYTCSYSMAESGYCAYNQSLPDCCCVAAVTKYTDELFLQLIEGQTNSSAGANNTNDVQTKLLLLGHIIGDMHQPLHVDLMNDIGGNDFNVTWFGSNNCDGYQCELHEVWDTLLIELYLNRTYGPSPVPWYDPDPREAAFANDIRLRYGEMYDLLGYEYNPVYWASETVSLAAMTYLQPEGFNVGELYYQNSMPIVMLQLYKAGRRLASVMDFLFSGAVPSCSQCQWWPPLCRPEN